MKNNITRGALCCSGCVLNIGYCYLMSNLAGLFCVPLATKLGVGFAEIAIIWTTLSLGSVIARSFQGQLYDRFDPKLVTLIGGLAAPLALISMAYVTSTTQIVIIFLFVGILNTFCGSVPFALLGSKWIGIGRGTIIGLSGAFAGIITLIVSPIAAKLVGAYSFETVAVATGIILGALHVVTTLVFVCKPPEAYGMNPIDIKFLAPKTEKAKKNTEVYETKMPIKNIIKLPIFWVVLLTPVFVAIAQNGFYSNRNGIWAEMGIDLVQIGTLGGMFTLFNALSVWLFGFLCDKIGFRKTVLGFAGVGALVYGLFPVYAGFGYAAGLAMTLLFNVGQFNAYIGPNVMVPLFGRNKSNVLISWSGMISAIGGMLAPVIIKFLSDYQAFMTTCTVLYVLVFVLMLIATKPSQVEKIKELDKKYIEEQTTPT